MKRVIVVHRWEGGPEEDWRPWLKIKLEKIGIQVIAPQMPDMETPVIEKWVGHLVRTVGHPDQETYFVGHSIGCQTILRYLETIDTPVGGAVFVSGWFNLENLEDKETADIAHPWITTTINFEKIKKILPVSRLIISDNDPFGAFEENKRKFNDLGSNITVLHGAGHITAGDGFTELPELLVELKKMIITV